MFGKNFKTSKKYFFSQKMFCLFFGSQKVMKALEMEFHGQLQKCASFYGVYNEKNQFSQKSIFAELWPF